MKGQAMKINRILIILLLIAIGLSFNANAQDAPLQGFDDYVNKARADWDVPGVAIAIVKDDKIVLAKGYGVRELNKPAPVDERTIFAIGSSSKAFTAAALAMLVDEGKVKWDEPVTKYLPGFELYDAYAAKEMTVRDLLCHRSGLARGDLMWYGSAFGRDEIVRRARYLKPSWSFRSQFGYQNIMYLAAGQIVQAATGKSWDDFIKERFFKPLGMAASSTSINGLKSSENVATPHAKIDEKITAIAWRNIDNIAPAGSINSNVIEMASWIRLQLNQGSFSGQQLLSSGAITEMHKSHTIIPSDPPWTLMFPQSHFLNYGLGWFLYDYRGRKIVDHGGNIDGMSALVAMVPEEKLGLVILTNLSGSELRTALKYRIFDVFFAGEPKDWSATHLKTIKGYEAQVKAAEKKRLDERVKDTKPSLALDKYAGTYEDEMYGEVKVAQDESGKLVIRYGQTFMGDLEHWHYDTFRATWRDRTLGKALVTFALNASGKVEAVKVQNLTDFKRQPEKPAAAAGVALSEAELKKFAGRYERTAPPLEVSIELVGGKLKAVIPGQPVATLVPVSADRFTVEGAPAAVFVQFKLVDGKVNAMTIEQGSNPALTFTPKT
jgi:CubicO group peptidase (beta-lactamase class C family)